MHIHAVPPCLPGAGPLSPILEAPIADRAATIRQQMADATLDTVLAMGRLDAAEDDPLGVDETLEVARLVPGMFAIGAMDPRRSHDPAHIDASEKQIQRGGIVALKAYLGYLPFEPAHPGYLPYYELARRYRLPIILHTGDTWSPRARLRYAHPLLVDDVAVDHPDVEFVIAHVGNPWMLDAAEVVYKNVNVWADLSGLAVGNSGEFTLPDRGMKDTRKRLSRAWRYADRPNRFLFGSDWPLAPIRPYRDWVSRAVPEEHRDAVLSGNARRLFRLEGR